MNNIDLDKKYNIGKKNKRKCCYCDCAITARKYSVKCNGNYCIKCNCEVITKIMLKYNIFQ